ncbi:MAG: hypothetical protein AB7V77_05735 [Candidatus Woesearchaeota archaeon]
MKAIKNFEEFITEKIVKIQAPNKSRAKYLLNEAEKTHSFLLQKLKMFEINDKNANDFVKSCYDIIMEAIRAKMLLDGYNAQGLGAHEAEVAYLRKLKMSEKDIQFLDQLRYFRNGMLYYGTLIDKEYAEKVIKFLKKIYPLLLKLI